MNDNNLNIIYKITNTNLFKIQHENIIDMQIDSVLIDENNSIETNLNVYNSINFNDDISKLIYEYFSNKSKLSVIDFYNKIKSHLEHISNIYLDFSKYNFSSENLKLFKAIFVFTTSLFSNICISDELYQKLNVDNDLHYFIKDFLIFRKYMEVYNTNDVKLLLAKDHILVYKIHNIYYLFNINSNPVKFELPISMQNKVYYSVMCNNDKHLRDVLIIGKNHFFVFEEIE